MGRRPLKGRASSDFTAGDIAERPDSPPVVAFDFDGTLTVRDSFTSFLKWRAGSARYAAGMARLWGAGLRYVVDRDRGRIKAAAAREFLYGVPCKQLEEEARAFAKACAQDLMRHDAVATFRWWREREAVTVIVTASPEVVVAPFARALGASLLIGTQLDYGPEGRVTGAFSTPNCRGAEKVKRLREHFGPDLRLAAAYGDTAGDKEMLEIAEEKGYRVFKSKP